MSALPIRTIIFDLSEVLLTGMWGTAQQLTSVMFLPPESIDRHLKNPVWQQFQVGRASEEEYWEAVRSSVNWNIPVTQFQQAVRRNFREIDGVRPQIVDLRRRGYRLGLLSNHVREWADYLESQFRYHHLFNDVVYSFNTGYLKPERMAFQLALRRLRADPETTLVIDDQADNLLTARELGCHVLQFLTPHQLSLDLRHRGLVA